MLDSMQLNTYAQESVVRSEGPSLNSHGRETLGGRVINSRAPKVRHYFAWKCRPSRASISSGLSIHGLTAMASE
jgi:hypothetical protein